MAVKFYLFQRHVDTRKYLHVFLVCFCLCCRGGEAEKSSAECRARAPVGQVACQSDECRGAGPTFPSLTRARDVERARGASVTRANC